MTEPFGALLSDLAGQSDIGTILYLGVQPPDPEQLLSLPAQHVALVVPAPLLPAQLAKRVKTDNRLSLHPVLVGREKGQVQLSVFNFPAMSSAHAPTAALRALFPNLKNQRRVEIDTLPLGDLIEEIPSEDDRPDMLVIDLPGEEADILAALRDSGAATRFAHILLRAGQEAMYEGTQPVQKLCAQLEAEGYRTVRRDLDDPDFPCMHMQLEPLALKVFALEVQLSEAQSARDELQAALKKKDAALAEAAEVQKSLTAERDSERQARKEGARRIEEMTAELEKHAASLKDRANKLAEAESRVAELERTLSQTSLRQRAIEDQVTCAEAQIDLLRDLLKLSGPTSAHIPQVTR